MSTNSFVGKPTWTCMWAKSLINGLPIPGSGSVSRSLPFYQRPEETGSGSGSSPFYQGPKKISAQCSLIIIKRKIWWFTDYRIWQQILFQWFLNYDYLKRVYVKNSHRHLRCMNKAYILKILLLITELEFPFKSRRKINMHIFSKSHPCNESANENVNFIICKKQINQAQFSPSPHNKACPVPLNKWYPWLWMRGGRRCLVCWAGIFKQSMGARNRVGIGLSYRPAMLHSLAELVPWNRFLASLKV